MLLNARRLRLFARILLALFLLLSGLTAGAFYLLQRNPEALAGHFIEELSARTGLSISVDAVSVALLPVPALAVSNVTVTGENWHFTAAYATLRPDFAALIQGRFEPRNVSLLRPRVEGTVPVALSPGMELKSLLASGSGGAAALPGRCRLAVQQGELRIRGADDSSLLIEGAQCDLEAKPGDSIAGNLSWAAATLVPADGQPMRLESLNVDGKTSLVDPLGKSPRMACSGVLRLPDWLPELKFSFNLTPDIIPGKQGLTLAADLGGSIARDGINIPFKLAGGAAWRHANLNEVSLNKLQLALGPDSVSFDGAVQIESPAGPTLEGSLQLHRASLTRWLGFARNLAPGLQLALDELSEGLLVFDMDAAGLRVSHIEVTAAGSRFTGTGGVADWRKPEVALDLFAENVNLGRAIPEAVGDQPEEPKFEYGPLTPMPGAPLMPGEIGVDYNIRLAARKVDYGPIAINDALVVIRQGLIDAQSRLEDTLLLVEGKLYGGNVKGETILGGDKSTPYSIRLRARDVNGENLGKDLKVMPVGGGRLRADVDIMSQGRELDVFLSKLRGSITARAENGFLRAPPRISGGKKTAFAFTVLDIGLKVRTAAWDGQKLGLEGQWNAAMAAAGLDVATDINGRLWFSGDGADGGQMDFTNLPGSFSLRMDAERSFDPEGVHVQASGRFSGQSARNEFSVSEGHFNALGVEAHGQASFIAGSEGVSWQGKVSAYSPDMARTLRLAGLGKINMPKGFSSIEMDTRFRGDPNSLSLRDIRAKLDESSVTGTLNIDWRDQVSLNFKLNADQFDLDRYMKANEEKSGASGGKPWDLRFMRNFRASGEFGVNRLTAMRFTVQNLRTKYKLENGKLTSDSITGQFYGAPIISRISINFTRGFSFANTLTINDFDLTAASNARGGAAALTGRGSIHSEVHGNLTGPDQLPALLNGKWRIEVLNGSFQHRTPEGKLKGKPTMITASGASGNITNGVARSSDFYLKGPGLQVSGGGWINFNSETLDCNFDVSMKNVPDFPLRLYGSLSNTKTSIGAGTLILNTLGDITKGFVDVLGGILEGTWKLFR
ncbi:MAG: hypothetical protein BCS36_01235 [Desulfovibrio sp. MES5]|uniref:AsmA family protein n=1 Tax=Desulfovibrio sp. MES5 TaxID=1899016 RepID=UPI000B9C8828|nr:AsmA-like C-terminal region-containing protein [Desulfovibrio sp. MES5]OXS29077.1 MAG: hypothetical protein BCS36_01235 [Desulfovibrio sp. MES5]